MAGTGRPVAYESFFSSLLLAQEAVEKEEYLREVHVVPSCGSGPCSRACQHATNTVPFLFDCRSFLASWLHVPCIPPGKVMFSTLSQDTDR